MNYKKLTDENLNEVIEGYMNYYNDDEGSWTYEKVYKRIHQIMTIEDSECLVQYEDDKISGFAMGYYKVYDDIVAYYLEEIIIFEEFQNKGYGTELMNELEKVTRQKGAEHIELFCITDEQHMHFYGKLGYVAANNLVMMGKHF